MPSIPRTPLSILFSLLLFSTALAQTQPSNSQSASPVVTATASNERVRYVSMGEVHQTRLQVFSIDGAQVFDSTFRLGNLVDWQLMDQQGTPLNDGSYLFLVTVKEFSDRLTQKYGTAVLEQGQVYLEQATLGALPQPLATTLDSNRQVEVLSAIDRIGAAGLNRTATIASPGGNSTSGAQPSSIESKLTTGGENISGTGTQNRIAKWIDSSGTLGDGALTESGGKLGIGTTSPNYELTLSGNDVGVQMVSPSTGTTASDGFRFGISSTNRAFLWNAEATDMYFGTSATERVRITSVGNVGIGTTNPQAKLDVVGDIKVAGNAIVAGNIAAKYQDVAEWVPSRQQMTAGTVVIVDMTRTNAVAASCRAYDTHIAGVVSAQPGVILGEAGAGKVMVATTGRVKVKVDARRHPIKIGDLLVTSNRAGRAMRSRPIRVAGTQIHRPGTIIGKALEPLARGQGEILVLLSLQ